MIEITEYKKNPNAGVILGNFTCKFHKMAGLVIKGFTHCHSEGKSWINLPSTSYEKDGKKIFVWTVFYEEAEKNKRFKDAIYQSLKKHFNGPSVHQDEAKGDDVHL